MRNRHLLAAAIAAVCLSAPAFAQDVLEVKRVPSDSLVNYLRDKLGTSVYFIKDAEDVANYTITASRGSFVQASMDELKSKGYSVTFYDGSWFVTAGKGVKVASLPAGWFDDRKGGEAEVDGLARLNEEENVMVTFRNKLYEIGDKVEGRTGKAVVHGYVRDISSGEPLVGVSVYDEKSGAYAATDADGFYRISLPIGSNQLGFSGYSLEDMKLNLMVYGEGGLDVLMKEKVTSLRGAVVSAESNTAHRDSKMGVEKIRMATIKKVPTAFGEADVLKVVLTLPGVKTTGEASNGFNVRGGATDQNLILFNDGTIFNPSHMFGVLSAFNADIINDVQLYKSSIPAEFGGRISSVLDIRGKEGNANKLAGSLSLGLLTSGFTLEGPLVKGKTTFMLGGRTTYSDWMLKALPSESEYSGGSAGFSDLNASVTHKFGARNSLHLNAYWSRDRFGFSTDTTFRYSTLNASAKWVSHLSDRNTMTLVGGYDSYGSSLQSTGYVRNAFDMTTDISQIYAKLGFKSVMGEHNLSYGLDGIYYDLNPGKYVPLMSASYVTPVELDRQNAYDLSLHVSDSWNLTDRISLEYGGRLNGYMALNPSKFYLNPELRLSGKWTLARNFTWKAGFNSMSQNIHMISNNTSISPMDTWRLSTAKIRPQTGWQAATGMYWTPWDGKVDFSVEGYWKRMYHYPDYLSGAVLVMNPDLEDVLVETTGKAYGVEFMARKSLGKLNGWVSYTYSRSLLRESDDRGIDTINGGEWYPSCYDKPHDFKLVANYKFTHRYSLSINVDYSTGRPITVPVGKYWYANTYVLAYSARNAHRIPDYFRMDAALVVEPGHYLKQLAHMSFTIGVYNVTARKNAYSVYYTSHNGLDVNGYMLSVFAMPIPYVNFNLKF